MARPSRSSPQGEPWVRRLKGNLGEMAQACMTGDAALLERLLKVPHGANWDDQGRALLCAACHHGFVDCIRLLLRAGAPIDQSDEQGVAALYVACSRGQSQCVRVLLDEGATADQVAANGATAAF